MPIYLEEINTNQFISKQKDSIVEYDRYLNLFSHYVDSSEHPIIDSVSIFNEPIFTDTTVVPSVQSKKVDIIK